MSRVVEFPLDFVELLDKLWEGELGREQAAQLEQSLCTDPVVCRLYLRYVDLYVGLRRRYAFDQVANNTIAGQTVIKGDNTGQQMVDIVSANPLPSVHPFSSIDNPPSPSFLSTTLHSTLNYFSEGMPLAYLLATVITGLGLLVVSLIPASHPEQIARNTVPIVEPKAYVGRITGMVDCKIGGSRVSLGQKYELAGGLMEITYDTGAKVILEGPVTYEVETNGGYLAVGKLTGKLEKKAETISIAAPFSIRTANATVTDLGTEFGVEVSKEGVTETQVFVGSVKVVPSGKGNDVMREQIIRSGGAVRIDGKRNQITAIRPSGRQFVRTLPPQTSAARADAYADLVLSMKPFAYYRMERPKNEKDHNVILDSAPGGHHGTLRLADEYGGDPWWRGRFGECLHLRGRDVSDYGVVSNFPASDTNQISVSTWVYVSGRGQWACIAADHSSITSWQFALRLRGEPTCDLAVWVRPANGVADIFLAEGADRPFPIGQWQHVAFVADGAVLHLYRNGVEVAAAPSKGVFAGLSSNQLTIGCMSFQSDASLSATVSKMNAQESLPGKVDELAIFHRALSSQEIQQLSEGKLLQQGAPPRQE